MQDPRPACDGSTHELLLQVDKIARTSGLSGSDILRSLLIFLARAAVERPGESVRETEIAAEVLGRKDFDPRVDSGVRVHTARLRAKLAEYYVNEGAADPIVIEIPKRSYQLSYRHRAADASSTSAPARIAEPRRWTAGLPWIAAAVIVLLALGGWVASRAPAPPLELRRFWAPFLDPQQSPMVVFATPRFLSSPEGLRPAPREAPPGTTVVNEYTGVGEVVAISRLTHLFDRFGREVHLKRSEMVTWDDARQQNMVLVGGPETNAVLAVLPRPSRFVFGPGLPDEGGARHVVIEDLRPPAGGARYYANSGRPYRFDHAVIVFTPAQASGRPILVLAGTTTMGTQAAAEFATDPESVRRLLQALGSENGAVPPFEALLKVMLRGGTPVSTELLAAHRM